MTPQSLFLDQDNLGLCTDLYELTMAAAYLHAGVHERKAVFELHTRRLPPHRNFLLAAGLEQALSYLANVRFDGASIDFLRGLNVFKNVDERFFEYLREFRFEGNVLAMPEGTPFFGNEPVIQVEARIIEAQIVETYLINIVNVQSMVASKAARICYGAGERPVIDFGSRRAHGPQTSLLAARAAYIGGCAGTSNVLAGALLDIPVSGTMAHSFVQFFDLEEEAFRAYYETFPESAVLLVDTYDTEEGIRKAARTGERISGVRLDSGNLVKWSRRARQILDEEGRTETRILTSGGLHEEDLERFGFRGAPVDGYGVGTDLVVSADAPGCDLVYKLVEAEGRRGGGQPRFKASEDKVTLPHRKQVHRKHVDGEFKGDLIAKWDEELPNDFVGSRPLLEPYMKNGRLCRELPDVHEIRETAGRQMAQLPSPLLNLHAPEPYEVAISRELRRTLETLTERYVLGSEDSR
ncbi:MAG: nicotinate phosphoribosyltransferase [Acidobacteriota bacterium]|jgi:nicotinate phosphoribosyltransferase